MSCLAQSDHLLFIVGCSLSINTYSVISCSYLSLMKPIPHCYVLAGASWLSLIWSIHFALVYDLPELYTKGAVYVSSFLANTAGICCGFAAVYRYSRIIENKYRKKTIGWCFGVVAAAHMTSMISQFVSITEATSLPVKYSKLIMVTGLIPFGHFVFGFIIFYKKLSKLSTETSITGIKKAGMVSNVFLIAILAIWFCFVVLNLVPMNEAYFSPSVQLLQSAIVLLEMFAATTIHKIQKDAVKKSERSAMDYLHTKIDDQPPVIPALLEIMDDDK